MPTQHHLGHFIRLLIAVGVTLSTLATWGTPPSDQQAQPLQALHGDANGHSVCKKVLSARRSGDAASDESKTLPSFLTHSQILISPEYDLRLVRQVAKDTRIFIVEISIGEGHPLVSYFIPNVTTDEKQNRVIKGIPMGDHVKEAPISIGSQAFIRKLVNKSLKLVTSEGVDYKKEPDLFVKLLRDILKDKFKKIVTRTEFIHHYGPAYELLFLKEEPPSSTYGSYYFIDGSEPRTPLRKASGSSKLGSVHLNTGEHGDSRFQTDVRSLQQP